jgi:hypothetical protein
MVEDEAEAICRRMAELRHELSSDVRQVRGDARVISDWKFYVRRFPWATVGIAVAVGFLLIPRKKAIISPDQDALAEMVQKKQLRLDVDHKREKPGMLGTLLPMAATLAVKTGMSYMGERMRAAAIERAHPPQREDQPRTRPIHH